ncbi:MAG: hypothetical protein WC798_02240 [Candidatus Paceibacterota bacterium]|jgi:pimeloyl-ACP methyl ester carboxylesterase
MRAQNAALFFIIIALTVSAPLGAFATPSIISQYSGVTQPYLERMNIHVGVADHRYFVATGTVSSIALTLATYKTTFTGTETFQLRLYNQYYSQWIDCETPVKTIDEWGMTHLPRDPYAPLVMFGPFTGTQCDVTGTFTPGGGPNSGVVWPILDGKTNYTDFPGRMGNNLRSNFTVYGADIPEPDPCATPGVCASNVLFLPGIQGSRLYEGTGCGKSAEEKLWEPLGDSLLSILRGAGDAKMRGLFLDDAGESVCSDVYTKEGDVIGSVRGDPIYQSFIDAMDELAAGGDITDWEPVAYDWRLSLDALLDKGAAREGNLYYAGGDTGATSTPYIEQTLRALAASSKTGKVTIVAHSNGGLVAKALLKRLGDGTASLLVDKVIMVGAPQSGAPEAFGAALVGHNAGIYKFGFPIVSNAVAQEFAKNAPMTYHLLPSDRYLASVASDADHPVARFRGDAYAGEIAAYGATIGDTTELGDFMRASSLNASLIDYANTAHAALDAWAAPEGIEVSQIAGWGADTIAGIDFYTPPPVNALTALEPMRRYRPIFTEDGDGTVPVPSALMMSEGENVKRYWVDLHAYNLETNSGREHKDLFEIPSLQDFIKNIITNSTSTLPAYVSTNQPSSTTEDKKLTFFLHSPLTLQLTDASGRVTGLAEDGSMTQDIPDSTYGEFGEVKYVTVPQGSDYELILHGQASGTFALEMQESSGSVVTASSAIENVPTTASTLASLTISGGLDTVSPLTVDADGDGASVITLTPRVGETIIYAPLEDPEPVEESVSESEPELPPTPEPEPAPSIDPEPVAAPVEPRSSSGGGGGGRRRVSIPDVVAAPVVVTEEAVATTTTQSAAIATSTPEIAAAPRVAQRREKSPRPVAINTQKSREEEPAVQKADTDIPQTAAAYDAASQQPMVKRWGAAVYNGFYGFWVALKKFF